MIRPTRLLSLVAAWLFLAQLVMAAPIVPADVKHDGPVDFEKEILPIFRKACLACHNATEAEGKFVIETPASILKGGSEGPAVVPGKAAESLLLKLAAHEKEPLMPPPDNDVKAKPLTPQELGLIKLWINEGAKGTVSAATGPLAWQPLPAGLHPIHAAAISPDGQIAAAARANQVFLYHIPSKRELGRLTDPSLIAKGVYKNPGVAELDLVQSLRFSPDGSRLASGGFRTVKLWKRTDPSQAFSAGGFESVPRSLVASSDGKQLALGEENGKIRLLNPADGKAIKTLEGHTGPVAGLAFSADGTKLLSGSHDKTVRLWDVKEAKQLGLIDTPAVVNGVAFLAEEKTIAIGSGDNKITTWNLPAPKEEGKEAPKPIKEMAHNGPVNTIRSANNGAQIVSGSADGQLRVWDTVSGNAVKTMPHGTPVEGVIASADGKRYAAVGAAGSVKTFNGENNQPLLESKGDFRATLKVGDLTRIASLAKRNVTLSQADFEEAKKRKTSEEENDKKSKEEVTKSETEFKAKTEAAKQPTADKAAADQAVVDATAKKTAAEEAKKTSDAAQVAAAEAFAKATPVRDAAVKAANDAAAALKQSQDKLAAAKEPAEKEAAEKAVKDAEAANKTAADAKTAAEKSFAETETAKKSADEKKQAADKALAEATTAFTQADQKQKQVLPIAQKAIDELNTAERNFKAAQRSVERAAEAVKKAGEAVPQAEAIVKQFEEAAKKAEADVAAATKTLQESEKPYRAVALASDGRTFAAGGDDGLIHLFDLETGAAVGVFPAQASVKALAYAGDLLYVAGANQTVSAYVISNEWKLERTIGSPDDPAQLVDRVTALDFSHDGKLLATGGGEPSRSGEIKIWSTENGALARAIKEPHSDTVFGLEFSPDDTLLASCGADRFMKIFRAGDGTFVRSFEGHTHHVTGVSWRADGRVLASCGADAAVKVWDARTGDQQRTVQGFTKEVTSLRFTADGEQALVSTGANLVRMINTANGGNVRDFPNTPDYMYVACASADGKTILAGGQDGVVRVWTDAGAVHAAFEPPAVPATSTPAGK